MAEVGVELQEPELLQAGDIGGCPFLQGIREVLGEEAVHDYLRGLGSAAVAEKRAMYEKAEPAREPAERSVEPESSKPTEQAITQTSKQLKDAQAINYGAKASSELLAANRTHVTEAAKESANTYMPVAAVPLISEYSVGEIEPPETSVAVSEAAVLAPIPQKVRLVLSSVTDLEPGIVEERARKPATPASVTKEQSEPAGASVVAEPDIKITIVPEAVDGAAAEAVTERNDPLVAVQAVEKQQTVEEVLFVPEVTPDGVTPQMLELEPEEVLAVEAVESEPVPPLSKRLEPLITETVELERRAGIQMLVAKVYELAELIVAEPVNEAVGAAEAETGLSEQTAELERVVERLLQALGVDEPTVEQVQQLARLVQREVQARVAEPEAEYWLDEGMHERLQGLTAVVGSWWPSLAHQLLGRLALLRPTPVE